VSKNADLPILPGATLGVMGGGQLGRMFVHAAQRMGYFTAVLDPDADSPAGRVSHHHVHTDYLDVDGLARLAAWPTRSPPSSRTCRRAGAGAPGAAPPGVARRRGGRHRAGPRARRRRTSRAAACRARPMP
jgi:hypothetical protein